MVNTYHTTYKTSHPRKGGGGSLTTMYIWVGSLTAAQWPNYVLGDRDSIPSRGRVCSLRCHVQFGSAAYPVYTTTAIQHHLISYCKHGHAVIETAVKCTPTAKNRILLLAVTCNQTLSPYRRKKYGVRLLLRNNKHAMVEWASVKHTTHHDDDTRNVSQSCLLSFAVSIRQRKAGRCRSSVTTDTYVLRPVCEPYARSRAPIPPRGLTCCRCPTHVTWTDRTAVFVPCAPLAYSQLVRWSTLLCILWHILDDYVRR
jgi:hypothetical protein